MTDYTPTNPSLKQYHCEHPGYICHKPARRYVSGRRVCHRCDDHKPRRKPAGANKFATEVK